MQSYPTMAHISGWGTVIGKYRGGVGSALPSRKHVALMLGDVCVLLCAFPVSVMRIGSHVRQLIFDVEVTFPR